jgi:hypothetical protein
LRVLKNPWFARFARKERISDAALCDAVARAENGLIDADLGGGLIKQRVARPGAGKSGGYRTLVLYRNGERAVFAFGFAKSGMDNIDDKDEARLKALAEVTLGFSDLEITMLVEAGKLVEVRCDG